jgi:hypothetical protein
MIKQLIPVLTLVLTYGLSASTKSPLIKTEKHSSHKVYKNKKSSSNVVIKEFDDEIGTFTGFYNTTKDNTKITLSYHFNPAISFSNFADISKISTIEVSYTKRLKPYWINFLFQRTSADEGKLTDNPIVEGSTDSILTAGLGLYQRFHLFDDIFGNQLIYESVEANMTYSYITNNEHSTPFTGFGLKTDFAIFYRHNSAIHYGLKLSYNLIGAESSTEVAHTISWISIGVDLSFYF